MAKTRWYIYELLDDNSKVYGYRRIAKSYVVKKYGYTLNPEPEDFHAFGEKVGRLHSGPYDIQEVKIKLDKLYCKFNKRK